MARCGFLTNHARVLLCIAHDPGARLRDIAASLGITERSAHGIVTDLAGAGYVIRQKDGHRNATGSRSTCRCPSPAPGKPAIGEVVALFAAQGRPAPRRHTPQSPSGQSAADPLPVPPLQQITHSLER